MRMAFGLVGLVVTIGVIAWFMHEIYLPDVNASLAAKQKAETLVNQINATDANGIPIEQSFSVFADTRDDNKLQDLQVTRVVPGSPMDVKYGLRVNDVILAAIDGHTVRTDMAGLDNQQAGMDAIHDAYSTDGQIEVQRGNQKLILPLPKNAQQPPAVSPPPQQQAQLSPQMQQNAQKTEQQQEGKSNDGSENGTMDELHQRLHSIPGGF